MDFDQAIAAHADWKAKLRAYIKTADKSLNPAVVEQDNQCTLGKWIYGEGSVFKENRYHEELRQEHAKFHKLAGSIVREIDLGNLAKAETMIDASSSYTETSMNVVTKIRKMRSEIEK